MGFLCDALADFVVSTSFEDLPDNVVAAAEMATLDALAAVLGGVATTNAAVTRQAARMSFGAGTSNVWFVDESGLHRLGAMLANCAAASALDIDDGHRGASGHPGAAIVPAVLMEAAERPLDGRDLLTAIVLGYDVALRVASARRRSSNMSFASGIWTGYGVAAALGWLRRLDRRSLAHSIAIAGVESPQNTPQGDCMSSSVKGSSPWSTVTAAVAVDRASLGATGPIDLLDRDHAFDCNAISAGLGTNWQITGTYRKPYASCRYTHPVIDAIVEIQSRIRSPLPPNASVRVEIFPEACKLPNDLRPQTLEAAQFSLPFTTALAALKGPASFLPMRTADLLDADVLALSERVQIIYSDEFIGAFPTRTPARVMISNGREAETATVLTPLGDVDNPMSRDEVGEKLLVLARGVIADERAHALIQEMTNLRFKSAKDLLSQLTAAA